MNRNVVLKESSLWNMLERTNEKMRIMAPVRRGRNSFAFDWVEDPKQIQLQYVRTVLSPKQALLPSREPILEFTREPESGAKPVIVHEPYLLFGVHACDLAAIGQLDWSMMTRHGITDPSYKARRAAATIIGIECVPDKYCFCSSIGTADTRKGADLFLTPIEGGYFVEVLSENGGNLLRSADGVSDASEKQVSEAAKQRQERAKQVTCKINAKVFELPNLLAPHYETEIFQETAKRCYSCGTCTNVCPTCFCFDLEEQVNLSLNDGSRIRKFDSCQFKGFAEVAGGHDFRGKRPDRVRHRWFRKFVYLNREFGFPFCVGCGRCSQACTANISLVDVLNSVIRETRMEAAK